MNRVAHLGVRHGPRSHNLVDRPGMGNKCAWSHKILLKARGVHRTYTSAVISTLELTASCSPHPPTSPNTPDARLGSGTERRLPKHAAQDSQYTWALVCFSHGEATTRTCRQNLPPGLTELADGALPCHHVP
eukprot:360066-Chlamydomonas_euryale.AAC.4